MRAVNYIGALLISVSIASCTNASKEGKADNTELKEKVYPVRVEKIAEKVIPQNLEYTANLVAFKEIHYAPASPGRIDKIHVEVGNHVKKGQLLVETDRTQLLQAQTQLANAESSYRRIDTLYHLGSISQQQYDQAKTSYELAKSNVEFLKENTTLESPINGIITGKYFENGELYSGAPNTAAGKAAVISLMQVDKLKAMVSIPQTYFPLVKKGMEATIITDVYSNKTFSGTVYKVYPTIDQATRTFQVEIIIQNKSEVLRPGMYANITLKLKDVKALVVPSISVLKQEGTNNRYVFVNDNGTAKQIRVKLGQRFNDQVEIISDELHAGMELIVVGQANLLHGSKVNVVTE